VSTKLSPVALAVIFASLGFAQTPDRTFYLTNMTSSQQMAALATMLRTVIDFPNVSIDESRHAATAHGTVDQMVGAEWLIHELDQQPVPLVAGLSPDFRMAGEKGETVRIFRLARGTTNQDLTAMTTAIRTVVDIPRLFPFEWRQTIVARASLEQIEAADWMVRQLAPADGKTLTGDSPAYAWKGLLPPNADAEAIRVFRVSPDATNGSLTAMVTAIRTVADVSRIFPLESGKAIVARASVNRMALAEWLVHELNRRSHPTASAETRITLAAKEEPTENVVRVFYVAGSNEQVTKLVTDIRTTARISRIFPYVSAGSAAIVMRGRADQMASVESMVAKFSKTAE
jgi:hypothetical protein